MEKKLNFEDWFRLFYDAWHQGETDPRNAKYLLERYIFERKGVKVNINMMSLVESPLTMNMIAHAVNYYLQKITVAYLIRTK